LIYSSVQRRLVALFMVIAGPITVHMNDWLRVIMISLNSMKQSINRNITLKA